MSYIMGAFFVGFSLTFGAVLGVSCALCLIRFIVEDSNND